jgi:hypothetical protein
MKSNDGLRGWKIARFGASLVLATAVTVVNAQQGSWVANCQNFGMSSVEPFGDRPAHNLVVSSYSCRVSGGAMDGSVTTGTSYWDASGPKWILLTGNGAGRKAGGLQVFQQIEGAMELTMRDGKAVGWTATGRGRYLTATGTVSELAGREFRWNARSTGFNAFTIESATD